MRIGGWLCGAVMALGAVLAGAASAQPWPERNVRLIVPYGAGNVTDVVARALADELGKRWGKAVVVENIAGAGGSMGAAAGAQAKPDGHTLTFLAMSALAITQRLNRGGVPYDPLKDFSPISLVATPYAFLAVHKDFPARSVDEMVAAARNKAVGQMFYYSPGSGTISHLNMEILRLALNFPIEHVSYKTSAAGLTDLLGGRVHATIDPVSVTLPHIRTGALRALAYTGPQRHPEFPDVPTVREAAPNAAVSPVWLGIVGPRDMAPALVNRIALDLRAAMAAPEFVKRMPSGLAVGATTPEELGRMIRTDYEKYGKLINDLGLKPE